MDYKYLMGNSLKQMTLLYQIFHFKKICTPYIITIHPSNIQKDHEQVCMYSTTFNEFYTCKTFRFDTLCTGRSGLISNYERSTFGVHYGKRTSLNGILG